MTTTPTTPLFQPFRLGDVELRNRAVMAPMTRSRALGNVPNELMATYYAQRAGAGLIITEGVSPSPNGLGYPRIPGLFDAAQVEGWRGVTNAVHARGGRIFAQLMHTGRVTHPANLPEGGRALAPSAVPLETTKMWVDPDGERAIPVACEMTDADVHAAISEFARAARNAVDAGFDGIELHAANGYLLEQFLHPHTNRRGDAWGGSVEARRRFVLEVARATAEAIGAGRVGIRLSPHGVFNEMPPYPEIEETYTGLAREIAAIGLAYVHIVDHSAMGAPAVPESTKQAVRESFGSTTILCGGYDFASANRDLEAGKADLIGFGRPYIANPDLLERFAQGAHLNEPQFATFYAPGPEGYTDYPTLA